VTVDAYVPTVGRAYELQVLIAGYGTEAAKPVIGIDTHGYSRATIVIVKLGRRDAATQNGFYEPSHAMPPDDARAAPVQCVFGHGIQGIGHAFDLRQDQIVALGNSVPDAPQRIASQPGISIGRNDDVIRCRRIAPDALGDCASASSAGMRQLIGELNGYRFQHAMAELSGRFLRNVGRIIRAVIRQYQRKNRYRSACGRRIQSQQCLPNPFGFILCRYDDDDSSGFVGLAVS
jgi:hypothetical protein